MEGNAGNAATELDPAGTRDLSNPLRWLAGSFGLGALGAGSWAVFTTDNGTGSAALIAVGALLLTVGLIGRLTGLKVAGAEASFGTGAIRETAATLESIADQEESEGNEDTASELQAAAERLNAIALTPDRRAIESDRRLIRERSAGYERAVLSTLRAVTEANDLHFIGEPNTVEEAFRWDAAITTEAKTILVDVSYFSHRASLSMRSMDRIGRGAIEVLLHPGALGVLLVSNESGQPARTQQLIERLGMFERVAWNPGDPPDRLASATRRLLGRLGSS